LVNHQFRVGGFKHLEMEERAVIETRLGFGMRSGVYPIFPDVGAFDGSCSEARMASEAMR
jgi:hypothetical protein